MNIVRANFKTRQLKQALKFSLSCPDTLLDPSTYMSLLQFCIDKNAERQAHLIHAHIITNGYESNLHLSTKVIIFYAKVGDVVSARKAFDRMPERNVVSWTAMISGYAQNGYDENALLVFSAMLRSGVRANQFTYSSALRACARMRWLQGGRMIQGGIQKGRFVENLFVKSALLDLYAKCGWIEDAWILFERIERKDVVSWNAMIGGLAMQGFNDDSFWLFRSMMRQGIVPVGIEPFEFIHYYKIFNFFYAKLNARILKV